MLDLQISIVPVLATIAVLYLLHWIFFKKVPEHMIDTGEASDGYHTFNELYEHRHILFISLMNCYRELSWVASRHHDGSIYVGYFIGGINLVGGGISYHIPIRYWSYATSIGIKSFSHAPVEWDGHTPNDVINRLTEMNIRRGQQNVD